MSWFAVLACAAGCLSTEGFYRYQDAGATGAAGTGSMGAAGTTGVAGTVGTAGTGGTNPTGVAGAAGAAGRGGATGVAGTTGAAGRGGTTGAAGTTGVAGRGGVTGAGGSSSGGVLFSDDFEAGQGKWEFTPGLAHMLVTDGTQTLNLADTAGEYALAVAGSATWTDVSVEARVKVMSITSGDSGNVAAICARLSGASSFYYFAVQSDGKGKIKLNNGNNTSLSSSIDFGFTLNTWYTMKLQVVGNTLTAFINGAQVGTPYVATETDKILPSGGMGLMVRRSAAVFDDVIVRAQ